MSSRTRQPGTNGRRGRLRLARLRLSRPRVRAPLLALALLCALPQAALAQQDQQIMPNYRDADLREVIEAVGAVTGRNFIVASNVRAQVTLLSFSPMTPETFYQAFLSMLQVHGFVALETGGVIQIVPDQNARIIPSEGAGVGGEIVTQAVQLENVGAAQLVPILRPLMPQGAHLAAYQGTNTLVLSDRAANIERLLDVIEDIDRAGDEDVSVIPLENASATEVVQMLGMLAQDAEAAGGAGVQLIADPRTNSVLLSGTEDNLLRYRTYIAYLDTPTDNGGDTRVRYLRYGNAVDMAAALQAQFAAGGAAAPAEGAPAAAGGGEVNIWADEGTNALVISAPTPVLQNIDAIIDRLDIRRAQVSVEAIIVEISEEKLAELGVTWIADGSDDDAAVGLTNFGSRGIVQLGAAASGDAPDPASIPQGVLLGLGRVRDGATSWAAIVSALRGDSSTNIVATQTLVTMDNEQAEISVGQEVPFLTGQFSGLGGTDGAVNPFQTINREEIGTRLNITPQINEGSGVRLTIEQESSSISQGASGAVDLITNNREITTSVFVDSGDVLVLGGLVDDQLTQGEQRVPVLGRIPGLGWLFRGRNAERVKTNLMVFIRPTVLRDGIDSRFETNRKYNFLRDLQREQAEEPIPLLRDEERPVLPDLLQPLPPARSEEPADESAAPGNAPQDRAPQDGAPPNGAPPNGQPPDGD